MTYYEKLSERSWTLQQKFSNLKIFYDLINNYDIIVTYGVSTTHTELSLCGKKTILIPIKHLPTFVLVDEAIAAGCVKRM